MTRKQRTGVAFDEPLPLAPRLLKSEGLKLSLCMSKILNVMLIVGTRNGHRSISASDGFTKS